MLRAGLSLDGELSALAASSHSGVPFHLAGVRRILAGPDRDRAESGSRGRQNRSGRCARPVRIPGVGGGRRRPITDGAVRRAR
jgi:hypothetical protein